MFQTPLHQEDGLIIERILLLYPLFLVKDTGLPRLCFLYTMRKSFLLTLIAFFDNNFIVCCALQVPLQALLVAIKFVLQFDKRPKEIEQTQNVWMLLSLTFHRKPSFKK